jgi:Ufm1-specific protease 2
VGSKQWIGAIELSYILDARLGVTSKIITVNSGVEMPSKAREIARHFDTQGEPARPCVAARESSHSP